MLLKHIRVRALHPCQRYLSAHVLDEYTHTYTQDERKTMEAINRMPKPVQRHMRKIYDEMVEAKQNCEAIAFRGHRLLDQVRGCGCECGGRSGCGCRCVIVGVSVSVGGGADV